MENRIAYKFIPNEAGTEFFGLHKKEYTGEHLSDAIRAAAEEGQKCDREGYFKHQKHAFTQEIVSPNEIIILVRENERTSQARPKYRPLGKVIKLTPEG